jgi:hypothetical protein
MSRTTTNTNTADVDSSAPVSFTATTRTACRAAAIVRMAKANTAKTITITKMPLPDVGSLRAAADSGTSPSLIESSATAPMIGVISAELPLWSGDNASSPSGGAGKRACSQRIVAMQAANVPRTASSACLRKP